MPKKKKNGPGAAAGQPGENPIVISNPGSGSAVGPHNLATMSEFPSQNKDEIVASMHDMFSHLDPDVIYIVLSEADFKVENAMDALLELSGAAEEKTTKPPSLSGFEMAAALLEPQPPHDESSTEISGIPAASSYEESHQELTSEVFDSLIDQELEAIAMHQPQPSSTTPSVLPLQSQAASISAGVPLSPHLAKEAFLELDQLDEAVSEQSFYSSSKTGGTSRKASPINELSLGVVSLSQKCKNGVDFSHLTLDSTCAAPRPSAFKAYRRPDQFLNSAQVQHSQSMRPFWNIQAPQFRPRMDEPAFITPVVRAPTWIYNPSSMTPWMASRPVGQAPLKPSATVPKSWMLSSQSRLKLEGQVLVLLRGAPGSGKSTLASALLEQNPGGVVLSTDDYFTQNGVYHYEAHLLGEAHAWNHHRAKEAFENGLTPIIIDNTNLQCWEMKPYVFLALKHKYRVLFREPNTWWKTKPRELEKRTKHGVTKEKIRHMLENYDRYVSVQNIMSSQPKATAVYGVDVNQTHTTEQPLASRPDLVGYSGFGKPGSYHSSSLPDVSSIDSKFNTTSGNKSAAEGSFGLHSSKEYLSSEENGTEMIKPLQPELLEGADLDWELDAYMAASKEPDCNINEDFDFLDTSNLEQPEMFSDSIGKRVKRVRKQTRTADGDSDNLNCDFGDSARNSSQGDSVEDDTGETVSFITEQQVFLGDWPCGSLEQRGRRNRKSACQTEKNPNEEMPNLEEDAAESDNKFAEKLNFDASKKSQKLPDCFEVDASQTTQETTQDLLPLGDDSHYSSLVIEALPALPDCILDKKYERSSDTGKGNCRTPSPIKDLGANQKEPFKMDAEEVCTVLQNEANEVLGLETCLEHRDQPSYNTSPSINAGAEGEYSSVASGEKRKGPSRKTGKACKLALTFMNQSSSSCPHTGSPVSSLQQSEIKTTSPKPLFQTGPGAFTQTENQDFALLWRIDQQKCSEAESDSCPRGITILEGNSLRFFPKINQEECFEQQVIPYRVCHEKGSQVEEKDLREIHFKQHSLDILSRHFKHVPKETLEDLYEKCHQDMEWATNLLLDSGEHLCRDDEENDVDIDKDAGSAGKESGDCHLTGELLAPNRSCTTDIVIEKTGSNCSENPPIVTLNNASSTMSIGENVPEDNNNQKIKLLEPQPEKTNQKETLDCLSGPSTVIQPQEPIGESNTLKNSLQPEMENEVLQTEILDVELKDEVEEDRETKEIVNAIRLLQLEEREHRKEEERKERRGQRKNGSMNIQTLELKLTTELALQLTELFGPVGVSPDEFSPENCSVVMDLNLAKLLHHKWKETIQEKHRQAALLYHLVQESSEQWGESDPDVAEFRDSAARFLIGTDGYSTLSNQSGIQEGFPFMDHWNVSRPPISLRDIMLEEQVLQDSLEKTSCWDLDKKDAAAIVKEKQLFTLFPTIDRHFLRDIFRDHNYSLEQTEQFLHTLLDDKPVRTVVASEAVLENNEKCRTPSKERKQKGEMDSSQFQDIEDPEYVDFRTEAMLQKQRQLECFAKASEAYRQGRKDVASFYAQQGHLHGQKMKEANHRAAVQIFERVNATLLPQNVLDLHGLHVSEALYHLQVVLANKKSEWQQGLCCPQLSVITGRGIHSQGGVARIRLAVLDYLKSQQYKYTEPKMGLVIIMLH